MLGTLCLLGMKPADPLTAAQRARLIGFSKAIVHAMYVYHREKTQTG